MPSSSRKRRDIARLIAERKRATQWKSEQHKLDGLGRILDAVNAVGMMEDLQQRSPARLMCFGPKIIHGGRDATSYTGVVIWYRRSGYHSYETLTLLGIWAQPPAHLIVGSRMLTYTGLPYSPESYFRNLQKDFTVYYGKSAPPPSAPARLYEVAYLPEKRIHTRLEIEAVLQQWHNNH